jgi:hypothetical protein
MGSDEDLMGDSFEKRRREQKKRQKKKEKSLRKNEREVDKSKGDGPGFEIATLEDIVGDLALPEAGELPEAGDERSEDENGEPAEDRPLSP